jgi:hypothetical protein
VYFVQEGWVRDRYERQQHSGRGDDHGKSDNKHKR